jgi:hypothetical protein
MLLVYLELYDNFILHYVGYIINLIIKNNFRSLVKLNFPPANEFNVEPETRLRFIISSE